MPNDFCMGCTGRSKKQIKTCEDKHCPFFPDRRANLPWQDARKKVKR